MQEIHVQRDFPQPPETVFALLSDHERFIDTPHKRARVMRPGTTERNGVGAEREVVAGPFRFVEDITVFERPRACEYRVKTLTYGGFRIPFEHERGWIVLGANAGGGTHVDWRSRFRVRVPLIGALVERIFAAQVRAGFEDLLDHAQAKLHSL